MKHVILGITSSIALYKSIDIVKSLQEKGVDVSVVFTSNALKLIDKNEFQVFVGDEIYVDTFNPDMDYKSYIKEGKKIDHIGLADKADLFLIVPATANIMGKLANGIADDLLTTTFLAADCQKIIAPAMNCKMWENEIVQDNVLKLKKSGVEFIPPEKGELACGYDGVGRLANTNVIVEKIMDALDSSDSLKGKKVLVTAGPTQEEIDPVRYISNRSSGKMGYALASVAKRMGADVVLVTGPTELVDPFGVFVEHVDTAKEMQKKVMEHTDCDIFISAAAVADYSVERSEHKIKKENIIELKLEKNPDIIYEFSKLSKGDKKIVGFALETENIIEHAKEKLKKKKLDLIVANGVSAFGSEANKVFIIDCEGNVNETAQMSKIRLAKLILDTAKAL